MNNIFSESVSMIKMTCQFALSMILDVRKYIKEEKDLKNNCLYFI